MWRRKFLALVVSLLPRIGSRMPFLADSLVRPGYYLLPTAYCLLTIAYPLLPTARATEAEQKHPVYVGVAVCARCHEGKGMGYQSCKWALSKHAQAYAALAKPEAKEIARLSGIPREPQETPMCLGCHATAADAEQWEWDDTFHIEDGVQCERCHGPGSEYSDQETMVKREAAMEVGLVMPTVEDCLACHRVKGSHVAVHKLPKLDMEEAWKRIEHRAPEVTKPMEAVELPPPRGYPPENAAARPKYTGVQACAACHNRPEMGYQFSRWRMSAHARASAVLGTPAGEAAAKRNGIDGDPLTKAACLKCHSTTYRDPAGGTLESYSVYEGVGCEACHGPGSHYSPEAVMRDKPAAALAGLKKVTRETCLGCHADTPDKPFDYEGSLKKIEHPTKLPKEAEGPLYKTPLSMALSPDGGQLYVACEASHTVIVVDVRGRRKIAEIPVGQQPTDVTFSPDGQRA